MKKDARPEYTIFKCKRDLAHSLLNKAKQIEQLQPSAHDTSQCTIVCDPASLALPVHQRRLNPMLGHYPERIPVKPGMKRAYTDCEVHVKRTRTTTQCSHCKIPLCVHTCFQRFHTMKSYKLDERNYAGPSNKRGRYEANNWINCTWICSLRLSECGFLSERILKERTKCSQKQVSNSLKYTVV